MSFRKIFTYFIIVMIISTSELFSQSPTIQNLINQVRIESLMKFVDELSGNITTVVNTQTVTIATRHTLQDNTLARDYIKQKFENYGLSSNLQNYASPTVGVNGTNVIGVKTGSTFPEKLIIVCAHYDDMPNGVLAPGSDDNASGVAGVIEAARILSAQSFPYTIVFCAFDQEEEGLLGSAYYVNNIYPVGGNIIGVINLDMIAYDSNNDSKAEVHARAVANSMQLKDLMLSVNTTYSIGLDLVVKTPGLTSSDHASFWGGDFTAVFLIENDSWDSNPTYHKITDKTDIFNQPYFEKLAKVAIGTLASLASDGVLPVELTSFYASVENNVVCLRWNTATEVSSYLFEIERKNSSNVDGWAKVGSVSASGNSNSPKYYSFTDKINLAGQYQYRLKQVDLNGVFEYSQTIKVNSDKPARYDLTQNYPNPFNPTTKITYAIPEKAKVVLEIFDILGSKVATLVNTEKEAGIYSADFNASNYVSGTYFYKLSAGNFVTAKKMNLIK